MAPLRHIHAQACVLTAMLFLVASCGYSGPKYDRYGIPLGPISYHYVEKNPLSHLYYPGSKVLYLLSNGSSDGPNSGPAYAGAVLTSNATGEQIYSWYIKKLKSMGWSFASDNGCATTQVTCPQFTLVHGSPRTIFTVAIDRPTLLRYVIPRSPPPACTVYEMSYEIDSGPGSGIRTPITWNGGNQCWWTKGGWHTPDIYAPQLPAKDYP